jgi:hypothetical protein
MDETRTESEQRIEIAGLTATVKVLRARITEDRRFATEKRAMDAARVAELEIHLHTHADVIELEEKIAELREELAEGDKVIDRIVVYMRKRAAEEASLREDVL